MSKQDKKIIEARNIDNSFDQHKVLGNISFSLNEGETLGIAGASGSGKSTLSKILVGIMEADSGEVLFREEAKNLFGSSAKYGAVYIITKDTFRKAKALANNPPNRELNKEEQLYAEIWEFYQTYRLIVVSGKVTDKEGNPLVNIRVYNKDRNTETYTDSLGNYTIKADRWDMLMVHCCTSCKLITDEEKEQEINFEGLFEGTYKEAEKAYIEEMIKQIPPRAIARISEDYCATPLFVLDGMPMDKKKFREKTSRQKISKEIHYLTPAAATAICCSGAINGVLVAVTEKAKKKYDKRQARKAQKKQ